MSVAHFDRLGDRLNCVLIPFKMNIGNGSLIQKMLDKRQRRILCCIRVLGCATDVLKGRLLIDTGIMTARESLVKLALLCMKGVVRIIINSLFIQMAGDFDQIRNYIWGIFCCSILYESEIHIHASSEIIDKIILHLPMDLIGSIVLILKLTSKPLKSSFLLIVILDIYPIQITLVAPVISSAAYFI